MEPSLKTYFIRSDVSRIIELSFGTMVYYRKVVGNERDKLLISDHMLVFILKGNKAVATPNHYYKIHEGEAIFVHKGSILVCEKLLHGKEFESIIIFFNDDFIEQFFRLHKQRVSLRYDNAAATDSGTFVFPSDSIINGYAQSLKQYLLSDKTNPDSLYRHKLEELFLILISGHFDHSFSRFLFKTAQKHQTHLDEILSANINKQLNVEHLAFLANRSLSQFKRDFRKRYGTSPAAWIRKMRLKYSLNLLLQTTKNVNEVCFESGFKNVSHFIQSFQKEYGITPLRYREKIMSNNFQNLNR